MAMFQGENATFKIILKDDAGDTIDPTNIVDIVASLYLESNYKRYVHWGLKPDPTVTPPENPENPNIDGLYDRDPDGLTTRSMVTSGTGDDAGFELYLQSEDTLIMPPGRYIIQITYNTTNAPLAGGENSTQKGALLTLKKALV